MKKVVTMSLLACLMVTACRKRNEANVRYFEIGIKGPVADWRDSSFVVAASNPQLLAKIESELAKPVGDRQIVNGKLRSGSGGYNKNHTHTFKWHFDEGDWDFADLSIEIYDGRAHSDLDIDISYWLNTVKRFAPWGSYLKKEIIP